MSSEEVGERMSLVSDEAAGGITIMDRGGSPMSAQHKVSRLNALLLSLMLSVLAILLLLSILGTEAVASASREQDTLSGAARDMLDSPANHVATTVRITKTVEPPDPDTGGFVSICFTISGLDPRSIDVALAQDVSGSMNEPAGEGTTQTRLEAAQAAADAFVSSLPDADRTAVVPFSTTAYVAESLTATKSVITRTIYSLSAAGETNVGESIKVSHEELITSPRSVSGTVKTIILLSDGIANYPRGTPRQYARERAEAAARDNIRIYTIGFGSNADAELLQEIADVSGGQYLFAPSGDALETIYLTIALELHNLVITDILTPGVETDCSQWPDNWCTEDSNGITTVTWPIRDRLLISDPAFFCFTATVNLDPNYEGPTNLPGSGVCYLGSQGQTVCEQFDNPAIIVGGRRIAGQVFLDLDGDGVRDVGERSAVDVVVQTSTGLTTTTNTSGSYVLRTSSEPTLSMTIEIPPGYVATTPVLKDVPPVTGIYTVDFGIRVVVLLPVVAKDYPLPSIINGGFEDGWTGWRHGGELSQAITSLNLHSGEFAALLGDPAYECESVPVGSAWVQQTLFVPRTEYPRLSFWYNIRTQDKNPYLTDEFDCFEVKINDDPVFRDAKIAGTYGCDISQEEQDLGWRTAEIDLGDYRGQEILIRFENRSYPDGWFNTWTYVDDVMFIP